MASIEGYIAIHRQILDSEIFASEKGFKIWIWLLLKARFSKGFTNVTIGNGQQTVELKRGQLIFGRFKAEEELNINGSTIYKWLQTLSDKKMINIESNTHYSIITIVKYNEYQEISNTYQTADEQHGNNTVTTDEQHGNNTVTHNKNVKNDNKVNNVEESKQRCVEILNYFGLSEMQHPTKLFDAMTLINSLGENLPHFENQFKYYKLYKAEAKEKIHSFPAFISDGWNQENWEKKYNDFKNANMTWVEKMKQEHLKKNKNVQATK